jgi:putative membrane protein
MILMIVISPEEGTAVYTEFSLPLFGMLALAGALAAIAMLIPGISGAFMLLVIGYYRTILQAVSDFNIILIIPVILGACFGLLIGAAFVRFLLSKAPRETYGAVLGLVAGSVCVLYPGGFGEGITIFVSIACLFGGFAVSFFMGKREF